MIKQEKHSLLGILINPTNYQYVVQQVIDTAKAKRNLTVTALAVHGVMTGVQDSEHRYRLNNLDLVCPDGQPIRWLLNTLYKTELLDRVYGPTLTLKICQKATQESLPVYFYGSTTSVLKKLHRNLLKKFPALQIAGMEPSRFRTTTQKEKKEIASNIRKSGAAIVFVGLGCPRQEVWIYEYKKLIPMPLIAVGAAFDFHAGVLAQAPFQIQKYGFEWLFRLIQEPRRLWYRYIVLNTLFIILVLQQWLKITNFDFHKAKAPKKEMLYG